MAYRITYTNFKFRAARGASVFASGIHKLQIQDSVVISSHAPWLSGIGGGLYAAGTTVTVLRSKFIECGAWKGGGAIYVFDASLTVEQSRK